MIPGIDKKVKTVILLMFENRSFDHMLGSLSFENINPAVDGMRNPLEQYNSPYEGDPFHPFAMNGDIPLPGDIPHEWNFVDTQLAWNGIGQKFQMNGFVKAYADFSNTMPVREAAPMWYFPSGQAPVTSFLARNFCVCDRWFCPLPTSTQPNRTMAFTGDSSIFSTGLQYISAKNNIFDWLYNTNPGIKWKVYHDYLTFFILYPDLWGHVFGKHFSPYSQFYNDWMEAPSGDDPRLIIIEPTYQDAPHINRQPNDNHAPLAINFGENFLRGVYETIISNQLKWEETVFIVYYDEHGGFYDHVPPPLVPYTTTGKEPYHFKSMGPRIPGIIVSPFIQPGSVCHSVFDHTSVLQLLTEIFTPGKSYSDNVEFRKNAGVKSISEALTVTDKFTPPQPPGQPLAVESFLGNSIVKAPEPSDQMRNAFEMASLDLMNKRPEDVKEKYPDLFQWKNAMEKRRADG